MKKNCTLFLLGVFLLAFTITATAQNTAFHTDGTGPYAAAPLDVIPDGTSYSTTVEGWFYIPSYAASGTGQHYFISQGLNGSAFTLGYDADDPTHPILAGDLWVNSGVTGYMGSTGVTMPVGQWVHIAVVEDTSSNTFTGRLYLNGKQVAQTDNGYYYTYGDPSSNSLEFGILNSSGNSGYIDGKMDEVRIWNTVRTVAQLRAGMYGTVDPASAGLVAYYKLNDGGTAITNSSTSIDNTLGTNSNLAWQGAASWVASPIQSALNALIFGGGSTVFPQVNIPGNAAYDLNSGTGGTIELYVYPASLSSTNSTLIANRDTTTGNTRYIFQVTDSKIILDNGTTSTFFAYALPTGTWSHLAFVYDGTSTTTVYYNNATTPIGTLSLAYGTAGAYPVTLGVTHNSPGADANPFLGDLDEVRFWSSQQLQSDISTNLYSPLTGSESGLVGLFNFDQGAADLDNTGLTTVLDNTASQNDASLANFALTTASASNFTSHTLVPLPVNFTSFTAVAQKDQTALLRWQTAQEQNSRDFVIERSVDGASYSAIGTVGAAGNTSSLSNYSFIDATPVIGRNYYRLKETDLDNKFMYSDVRIVNFTATDDEQKLVWFQTGDKAVEVDLKLGNNEVYTVSDISGRTIQQGQLSSGRLTISQAPSGMYFVKVTTTTGKQLNTPVIVK
ncbi:MAG TPA: LamG-like jellyroll fold domain-containing protein [Puia sp.]|nr:LamG-like jellyroll fold domain-containing protein [Puia sp.]